MTSRRRTSRRHTSRKHTSRRLRLNARKPSASKQVAIDAARRVYALAMKWQRTRQFDREEMEAAHDAALHLPNARASNYVATAAADLAFFILEGRYEDVSDAIAELRQKLIGLGVDVNALRPNSRRRTSRRLHANASKKRPSLHDDDFLAGYVEAMLFSSLDGTDDNSGGRPLDENYTDRDITTDSLRRMAAQCQAFLRMPGVAEAIEGRELEAGRDFWFTRNGHGVGFWDGDWPKAAARLLTKASKSFGESYVYVSRRKVHVD
jgi:hypothetical protein